MESQYVDIVFEGKNFSPKKLSGFLTYEIVSLAEAGELGTKGRYKGKPMPYGLGYIKISSDSEDTLLNSLEEAIDNLISLNKQIKESGVDEITVDFTNHIEEESSLNINRTIIKKISSLNANIEFTKIEDSQEIILDSNSLKEASQFLRSYNHPLRLKIISWIREAGELNIENLREKSHVDQAILSQHIVILRKAQIISIRRNGKYSYYSLNTKRISNFSHLAKSFTSVPQQRRKTA